MVFWVHASKDMGNVSESATTAIPMSLIGSYFILHQLPANRPHVSLQVTTSTYYQYSTSR